MEKDHLKARSILTTGALCTYTPSNTPMSICSNCEVKELIVLCEKLQSQVKTATSLQNQIVIST